MLFQNTQKSSYFLPVLLIIFVGASLAYLQWGDPVDDAYVSFVYARNLWEGNGLTFNPGERVEGYSNFLWVILCTLAGKEHIPFFAQFMGFSFWLADILLVYLLAKKMKLEVWALAPALLTALDLRCAIWSVEGLETSFYLFGILLTFFLYDCRGTKSLWFVPALATAMTRPEGASVFGAVAFHRFYSLVKQKERPKRGDFIALCSFIVFFLIYNLWRLTYFRSGILPNTYYARGGTGNILLGVLYLAYQLWCGFGPLALVLVFMALAGIKVREKGNACEKTAPAFWLLIGTAVVIFTGGDWMPNARFLVPLLPFVYIYCAYFARSKRKMGMALFCLLLVTNITSATIYEVRDSFWKRWARNQASFYMPVAEWLKTHTAQGKKVVLSDVGYITYYSRIRAIDTLGLTNKHLARIKGGSAWATDLNYIFAQRPDFIISMVRDYNGKEVGHTAFDRQLPSDERLHRYYEQVVEIYGYPADERALGDFQLRRYSVKFKIYQKKA